MGNMEGEKRKGKSPGRVGVAISDQVRIGKYQESLRKSYLTGRPFCSLGQRMGMYFCVYETHRPRQRAVYLWLSLPFIIIHKVVLDVQLLKELAFQQYFYPWEYIERALCCILIRAFTTHFEWYSKCVWECGEWTMPKECSIIYYSGVFLSET